MSQPGLPLHDNPGFDQGVDFGKRAEELLNWLASFGAEQSGGVTRLLYSEAWSKAQESLANRMRGSNLYAYYDGVGNLYGRLNGTDACAKRIMTGSHIDTVRNGGKYDGAAGIVAGLIALDYLGKQFGAPRHHIEVVSFCEEEGSRFPLTFWGSSYVARATRADAPLNVPNVQDSEGISLAEAMCGAGFRSESLDHEEKGDIDVFLELHVEQGSILERSRHAIGIVEGIVGQRRYCVDVVGEANHAGTTPMAHRKDAMNGAARLVQIVNDSATRHGNGLVATVGWLEAVPNVSNVIPERVRFTLDVRHRDEQTLEAFCAKLLSKFAQITNELELGMSVKEWMHQSPVPMNAQLTDTIQSVCERQHARWMRMPSGAGHDAQVMGGRFPTGLIFIPSRNGVSHSPREYTSAAELDVGIRVLIGVLYDLAYGGASL